MAAFLKEKGVVKVKAAYAGEDADAAEENADEAQRIDDFAKHRKLALGGREAIAGSAHGDMITH